ncbi:hypothetical protein CLU79DRAFT_721535 [Phycomyces nitens]|nr:hypothetical protein CLU79DRAFT_721535 [Phycomyces nitens]
MQEKCVGIVQPNSPDSKEFFITTNVDLKKVYELLCEASFADHLYPGRLEFATRIMSSFLFPQTIKTLLEHVPDQKSPDTANDLPPPYIANPNMFQGVPTNNSLLYSPTPPLLLPLLGLTQDATFFNVPSDITLPSIPNEDLHAYSFMAYKKNTDENEFLTGTS